MAITYPLSMPATKPTDWEFTYVDLVAVSRSPFTGERQTYDWGGGSVPPQFWKIKITWGKLVGRKKAQPVAAFLSSLRGPSGTFLAPFDILRTSPLGTGSGTPLVSGNQSAGASQLVTKGWTASASGVLVPGDPIQLGGAAYGTPQRIYECLDTVNADGSGNATINIRPALRDAGYNDGVALVLNNAAGTFALDDPETAMQLGSNLIYGVTVTATEAFPN